MVQFAEDHHWIELTEVERFATVGKRQADSSATGKGTGNFDERKQCFDHSIRGPNDTDRLVAVGVAEHSQPGRSMEKAELGMGRDKAVPHGVDGRVDHANLAVLRRRPVTWRGGSRFRGLSYQWGYRHEQIPAARQVSTPIVAASWIALVTIAIFSEVNSGYIGKETN